MAPLYPLTFQPRYKERIWGGRELESLYGRRLPASVPIGESWEISDRPGDESVIANGPLAGQTLRWLMAQHGDEIVGGAAPAANGRFPLLCKILDARQKLSLQVHPPADRAAALGGEPKTEMWYIADAAADAELFVGLKHGVTRAQFEDCLRTGGVADCFHRIPVSTGDTMFLPSGRVHAIGAGLVIFEIQQNSDTTYRVFDWDRVGLDGAPRELHVEQSLASIDFDDFEPPLSATSSDVSAAFSLRPLVRHALFTADLLHADSGDTMVLRDPRLRVLAVVHGRVDVDGGGMSMELRAGQFCLVPASVPDVALRSAPGARCLMVEPG